MKRRHVLAACLTIAAAVCSTVQAGFERLEPVPPAEPVPERVRREFDRRYGEAVKAALATETIEDDNALVHRIYTEAAKLRRDPPLLAHTLDEAIRLASICPDRQKLVYDTLKLQAAESLRPALPCYEKMMLIVPHVAEQLGDEVFAQWFDATCPADVRQLAMEADTEGRYESAIEVLKTVQSLAESRKLKGAKAVAEDVAGLEFMKQMLDARKQYEEDVKTPGDRRQAHIFLGIMALTRDADMDAALQHLRASEEPKAAQLADRLTGFKSNLSNTENAYQLAQATIALADDLEAAYLKLLLYKEAEGKLAACLAEPSFANRNARQIAALQQRTSEKSQQAMNQLPPLVRDRLKTVRQEASTDSEYVQTFFGVPLKNANSVVYVVDKSGSMTDSIMYCKEELLRAVYSLKDKQQFQILFYSTGPALAMGNGELTAATEENKKTARKFVGSVMPVGQTDPSDALRRAFRLRPDTIYLLTDGEFDKSIPKLIRGMNSAGKVTVNTVCFLYSNGEPMLKEIAQDNNGTYRYVSEDDLSNLKQMNQPP